MKYKFYRMECLTNLHMGSGDANYDIIDLQVERDPILGEPTMNSSGVKGALRDFCEVKENCTAAPDKNRKIVTIFGTKQGGQQQGSYVFFSADLLARPVRVSGRGRAWMLATTPDLINSFITKLKAMGVADVPEVKFSDIPEEGTYVKATCDCGKAEGYDVEKIEPILGLDKLLGTNEYVIMNSDQLREVALPVQAHNVLENGISRNLWYEEYVPHKSVFGTLVGVPDEDKDNIFEKIVKSGTVIQFGAEASTGCGYIRMEEVAFQ